LLERRDDWSPDRMFDIQTDIEDPFLQFLAGEAVTAYDARPAGTAALDTAVELLRSWDGRMEADGAAPMVATLLDQHIRKAVAERASPGSGLSYATGMAPSVVEQLLRERPEDWFEDYDQLILRSLVDAIEEGKRQQGDDPERWQYGLSRMLRLDHPVVRQISFITRVPLLGGYLFNLPDMPLGGSQNTVRQTTPALGPSLRMVATPGNWEESLVNIMPGQSGQILNGHWRDQWNAYWDGQGYPLVFQGDTERDGLEIRPAR